MALPKIKTIGTDNLELARFQEYVATSVDAIALVPILDGNLLTNVALTSGLNDVPHKLGRKLRGWIAVRKRANVDIWDAQDSNSKQDLTLSLQASSAVTVDLWVF